MIIVGHIRKPFATQLTLKTLEEMKYVTFSVKNEKLRIIQVRIRIRRGKNVLNGRKEKKCRKVGQIGWPCQRLPTYPQVQFSVSLNVPRDEITPGATNTLGAKTNKQKKFAKLRGIFSDST